MEQIFTFGPDHHDEAEGQSLGGHYVRVIADGKEMCRSLMFAVFGKQWSFQYDPEELPAMEEKYNIKCYGTITWKRN